MPQLIAAREPGPLQFALGALQHRRRVVDPDERQVLTGVAQAAERRAGGTAEIVDIGTVHAEVFDHLADHTLDFIVEGHGAAEHIVEDGSGLGPEVEILDGLSLFGKETVVFDGVRYRFDAHGTLPPPRAPRRAPATGAPVPAGVAARGSSAGTSRESPAICQRRPRGHGPVWGPEACAWRT